MNRKKIVGWAIIVFGFIMFYGAYAANKVLNINRGAKTKVVTSGGTLISEGILGYNKEGVVISAILFWLFILFGILLIIMGIVMIASASKEIVSSFESGCENVFQQQGHNNWVCQKCDQINSPLVSKCISCGMPLNKVTMIKSITSKQPETDEWKCANCGRINDNYVGTCGCGTQKP